MDELSYIPVPFSVSEFFKDAPWLHVPLERLADITIEPLAPRSGLLGGTERNEGAPPKSKLAALAAARRKENRELKKAVSNPSSVTILERLQSTSKPQSQTQPSSFDALVDTAQLRSPHNQGERKYPVRERRKSSPKAEKKPSITVEPLDNHANANIVSESAPGPKPSPSTFAEVMFSRPSHFLNAKAHPIYFQYLHRKEQRIANPEGFAGPSPDDIVIKAQKSSKGSK